MLAVCSFLCNLGKFQEFDYGPMNMEYYGQSEPPDYNLKNITAPMSLYYGTGDLLVSLEVSQTFPVYRIYFIVRLSMAV
jgi:hypothetical protein